MRIHQAHRAYNGLTREGKADLQLQGLADHAGLVGEKLDPALGPVELARLRLDVLSRALVGVRSAHRCTCVMTVSLSVCPSLAYLCLSFSSLFFFLLLFSLLSLSLSLSLIHAYNIGMNK